MPRDMFVRLECACLKGHQFAEVSKMMYDKMQQQWLIMSWSGHKDVKMLKPYMAVVDEMRRREMSKFDAL